MALIKCNECGGKVSDSAKVCPHCGNQIDINEILVSNKISAINRKKKQNLIIAGIIVGIVVFLVFNSLCLHGMLNWRKYIEVENGTDGLGQECIVLHNISDYETIRGITIHYVHYSHYHDMVRTTDELKYLSDTYEIRKYHIEHVLEDKIGNEDGYDESVIETFSTEIEYITWDKLEK